MRKVTLAPCTFIVLLLATFAASCADKTVTNTKDGFEVTLPEVWNEGTPRCFYRMLDEKSQSYVSVKVKVSEVVADTTLTAFVDSQIRASNTPKDYDKAEKIDVKLGGVAGLKLTVVHEGNKSEEYYVISGKRAYKIWSFAPQKIEYDKYAKDIDAIVKSFKLIETK